MQVVRTNGIRTCTVHMKGAEGSHQVGMGKGPGQHFHFNAALPADLLRPVPENTLIGAVSRALAGCFLSA
jgi:hypothetical protein